MPKASYKNVVLAESTEYKQHNSNIYFPTSTVQQQHLVLSKSRSRDPRFGTVQFFDLVLGKEKVRDAAWHYTEPSAETEYLKDHIAFMPMVDVDY